MKPLRWSWNVRFGPYARATLASQPLNLLAAPLIGFGLAFLMGRDLSVEVRVGAGIGLSALVVLLYVVLLHRQLRRRRQTARGLVQTYALDADSLVLAVGRDSYTLPTTDLTVSAQGRDWLAVRRQGMGRRPLILFFDDQTLVPQAQALLVTQR